MPGIYDLFSKTAALAERIPLGNRLAAGAAAGMVYQGLYGDQDLSIGERLGKGVFIGAASGGLVGLGIRAAGSVTSGATRIGKSVVASKIAEVQARGLVALTRPGTLMIAGAGVGAAIGGPTGAAVGAGIGLGVRPIKSLWSGYEALGRIPGGQTGALIAASTLPIAAGAAFGLRSPETEAAAMPGPLGMDYEPIQTGMRDRMIAMNASGDIVMGLNGRRHG